LNGGQKNGGQKNPGTDRLRFDFSVPGSSVHSYGESSRYTLCAGHRVGKDKGTSLRIADSFATSSTLSARLKTATPPSQPVKPTLRLLWITRPMVHGPPLPSFGV
jgi:hypothetical protein